MNDVVLHAFNWSYEEIANRAEEIARVGYGAVLFPPPFWSEGGDRWWQVYQPKDYRVLRSHLGNKAGLQRAISALQAANVRCYVDVVFNHMANESRFDRFRFPGSDALSRYASDPSFQDDRLYGDLSEGLFTEHDFHPDRNIDDWTDDGQVVNRQLSGLPDLSLSIAVVQEQIRCLSELVALGFEGFRVDAVKHLPVEHVTAVFQSAPLQGRVVFGETLTFNAQENSEFLWPVVRETSISFYDFPLQQTLKRAFGYGGSLRELVDPASCWAALPWNRALTFTITHDVPNNDGFRGMILDAQDEYLANAYVLGRDGGLALVYSDHGESAQSHPEDRGRWEGCWNRPDIAGMVRFHNGVQGTSQRTIWEDDGFLVFARGDRGLVAINKTTQWAVPEFSTWGLRWGDWRCQIHGHLMHLQSESLRLGIPPRQAQMWLLEG